MTTQKQREPFHLALEDMRRAKEKARLAIRSAYPPGSPIRWTHVTTTIQKGKVVDHDMEGMRIKVENEKTGREYWIYMTAIVEYWNLDEEQAAK